MNTIIYYTRIYTMMQYNLELSDFEIAASPSVSLRSAALAGDETAS